MLLTNPSSNQITQLKNIHKKSFMDGDFYIEYFMEHRFPHCTCFVEFDTSSSSNTFKDLGLEKALNEIENQSTNITGVLYARPISLQIGGDTIEVPFVTGLATHPEWRNKGIASRLLSECVSYFSQKKVPFLLLYPFDHDFYRKQGFQTISYKYSQFLKNDGNQMEAIAEFWEKIPFSKSMDSGGVYNISCLNPFHSALCQKIYEYTTSSCHAFHIRNLPYFEDLLSEHFGDGGMGALISHDGEPVAYVLLHKEEVREVISIPEHAWNLSLILNDSGINLHFPYSFQDIKTEKVSNVLSLVRHESMMAKACDIEEFLSLAQLSKEINGKLLFTIDNVAYTANAHAGKLKILSRLDDTNTQHSLSSYDRVFSFEALPSLIRTILGNDYSESLYFNEFNVYNILICDKY